MHEARVPRRRAAAQGVFDHWGAHCAQLGAEEMSWPIGRVAKVSLISGQFWGVEIPTLWARCYVYLAATLLFDVMGGFVKDNITVRCAVYAPVHVCEELCACVRVCVCVACLCARVRACAPSTWRPRCSET